MHIGDLHLFPPPFPSSSYFHWKLLLGGLILILLDSLMNFRLEYMYPVLMFMRSVYDSYRYQGFVSHQIQASPCVLRKHYHFPILDVFVAVYLVGCLPGSLVLDGPVCTLALPECKLVCLARDHQDNR